MENTAPLSRPTAEYPVLIRLITDDGVKIEFCALTLNLGMLKACEIRKYYNIIRLEREYYYNSVE